VYLVTRTEVSECIVFVTYTCI